MKRVRVLADATIDGVKYRPNQVVDLPDGIAAYAVKEGMADDDKAAVKQGLQESKGEVVKHGVPPAAEGEAAK